MQIGHKVMYGFNVMLSCYQTPTGINEGRIYIGLETETEKTFLSK